MDENLSEIERAEWLKGVIRDNWIYAVLGVAIALGGLYGWRAWQGSLDQRSVDASARFEQMLEALSRNEREKAFKIGAEIKDEFGSTPFADQAELVLARAHVESGELDKAATRLAAVMSSTDDAELALVARLRLARVQIAQGSADQALATLDGAKTTVGDARVQELRGDALLAKGDRAGALKAYQAARTAAQASQEQGLVDVELLELKIDDLAGAATAAAAP
ncbi:MAG: tetratricopeptide repeat protein [Steroidobacteraceae bacterium]|nr:tetratricopeptide repeat protein [Steroidobacteraceae bacterium]